MVLVTLESPDGAERVLIVRRPDGVVTYCRQWRSEDGAYRGWLPPGPDCGLYDSVETAEAEARQRLPWLRARFH